MKKTICGRGTAAFLGGLFGLGALNACATNPPAISPRPPETPTENPSSKTADATPTPAADPFVVQGTLQEEKLAPPPNLEPIAAPFPRAPAGLPAPPATCAAFVARKKAAAPACTDRGSALAALDAALANDDAAKRDTALTAVESCTALPVGFVRALRIELAPIACGDALALPILTAAPADLSGTMQHTLTGLALAARLSRTGTAPPKLAAPFDRPRVLAFIKGPVMTWMADQAKAIQALSTAGAALGYYGKAVVAVEAGLADLRVVEAVRAVPVPDSISKDPELKAVYEGTLDQMLDPRKDRGRDAALVGLRELATVGTIKDDRVTRARKLLSQLYAGRRIDALDGLLLPPVVDPPVLSNPIGVNERLAATLPTFYAGLVIEPPVSLEQWVMHAFASAGIPLATRIALRAAKGDSQTRLDQVRARIAFGQRYWRSVDFDEATALLTRDAKGGRIVTRSGDEDIYLALALALRGGPTDAAAMIQRPPTGALGTFDTTALDAIARATPPGPYAGIAAFDAALIRRIGAPRSPDPALWKDIAARFRAAAALLGDADRTRAEAAAREADAIAAEIGK